VSAWRSAKAICSSVNRPFFIASGSSARSTTMPENSHSFLPAEKTGRTSGVLRMMAGAGRELAIAHLAQDAAQGRLRERDLELLPDPLHQIDQPPAHDAVDGGDRPRFDHRGERAAMRGTEPGRLAGRLAVEQAGRSSGVEPDHPVPDDLQPYAAHLRRIAARA